MSAGVDGLSAQGGGEAVIYTGIEVASVVWVGACLSVSNTRSTMPRPTGDLPTINGFGVFIPKSVSGSGEAVFISKHAVYRGDGSPCRGKKSCLEIYGTGMYLLNGFGHMHSPAHMLN